MTGEDQERFEDYLELERYIEELQAGRAAHPPADLTPDQARIYRMAALFRSAVPGAAEPHPEFAEALRTRLLDLDSKFLAAEDMLELPGVKKEGTLEVPRTGIHTASEQEKRPEVSPVPSSGKQVERKKVTFFSRRAVLRGGAVAAASVVAGATAVGIDRMIQQNQVANTTQAYPVPLAIDANVSTNWHFVTTAAALGADAVRFVTDKVIGYVIADDDNNTIIAMSAACTHMGCIVQWQGSQRHFHCPCHDGLFTEYGKPAVNSPLRYLTPLPRLETKVENGKVYVKVPR